MVTHVPGVPTPVADIALGTMTFGDSVDPATAAAMVDRALEAGVTMIDTANGYAGGESERILSRVLAGRRDRIVLASKAGIPHPDAGDAPPLSPQALRACVEGSLRRLDTDVIDVFYLHQPDRRTPIGDTLTAVAELARSGKIRALGVSNYAAWQIGEVQRIAVEVGAPPPVLAQQLYNLLARRIEDEYVEFAGTAGVRTVVYNPLAGGLLTGRHRYAERPQDGRFGDSRVAAMYQQRYWQPPLFDAVTELSTVAEKAGVGLVELALRWLISKPATACVLLGGSSVEHLKSNLDALAAGPLPADVVAACDAATETLRGAMPAYNR
ncbi:MAG TPA: aldo/keto reductase [Mycobacteriales bacterium]|nr:aldo/keto reductase [Mycobacteriales bacterium]